MNHRPGLCQICKPFYTPPFVAYLQNTQGLHTPQAWADLILPFFKNLPIPNDYYLLNDFKDFASPGRGRRLLQRFSLLMLIPRDGEPSLPFRLMKAQSQWRPPCCRHASPSKLLIVDVSHLKLSKSLTDLLSGEKMVVVVERMESLLGYVHLQSVRFICHEIFIGLGEGG